MRDGFVIIQTYGNRTEAEMSRRLLEESGIEAYVQTDNAGGMEPQLDYMGGVRLLVPEGSAFDARNLLAEIFAGGESEPWDCPGCGEHIEAGFDVCWKCGTERPGS